MVDLWFEAERLDVLRALHVDFRKSFLGLTLVEEAAVERL